MTTDAIANAIYRYSDLPVENIYEDDFTLSYEELEEAVIDYLRKEEFIMPNEIVLSSDLPIPLVTSEYGNRIFFPLTLEIASVDVESDEDV